MFGLPNIKSAKKRVLIGEVRNARNKATKSELKTAIKKFEVAAAEGNRTEADGAYKVAVKKVDQAVAKGVLHKNTAAHRKSAMTLNDMNVRWTFLFLYYFAFSWVIFLPSTLPKGTSDRLYFYLTLLFL